MRIPSRIAFTILCATLLFLFTGCTPKEQQFTWKLYGTWVNQDGHLQQAADFTLSGRIPAKANPNSSVQEALMGIDTHLYPYHLSSETPFSCLAYKVTDSSGEYYFLLNGSAWHEPSKSAVPMSVWLFPEKEWVILYWNTPVDTFLVAATDPDADPAAIMELYRQHVHSS